MKTIIDMIATAFMAIAFCVGVVAGLRFINNNKLHDQLCTEYFKKSLTSYDTLAVLVKDKYCIRFIK